MRVDPRLYRQLLTHGLHLRGTEIDLTRSFCFNGPVSVFSGTLCIRASMDAYSYVGTHSNITTTSIGRYCSIADHVNTGLGIHRPDWPSTTVAFFSRSPFAFYSGELSTPRRVKESGEETGEVLIGHDVWIGARVLVPAPGITRIGTGSIIGAGAVVTHDVPPYAIVAGNPAKVIRMRFKDEIIADLMALKWWEYDLPKALQAGLRLPVTDVKAFISCLQSMDRTALPRIGKNWLYLEMLEPGKARLRPLQVLKWKITEGSSS